eukprot:XP_011663365.1 PREDICTED: uncharacterized protein LOC100889941 isoform X1 [Strongylocentrotus purpuratus]
MFVKAALTVVVILTCLTHIASVSLPYSKTKRDDGAKNERSSKDVSPGRVRASERKLDGNPSRTVPSQGSIRSAARGLGIGQKKSGRRASRRDVFVDFYGAKNVKPASYRHDDNMDDVDDDRCSQYTEDWSVDSDLMEHLIGILLTGEIGQNHENKINPGMVAGHNFMNTLAPVTRHGAFLEIGTGVTSLYLSSSHKMKSLVTTLIIPEPKHEKLVLWSKSCDAFIGSVSPKNIKTLVKSLVQDPEVFFGSILLSNLTALIGDNLPHEFEKLLGQVILLAKETYIAAPSGDQYTASYMHSWKSVQNLVARACSSLDVTCAISAITMESWALPTLTKVTLIEGQRPLNRRYCCEETLEDCSMTYRTVNGTEDIIIGASRHREVRFQGTGLLLSTLLKLNLVGSSLEKLVVPLLEMDYRPERLARNILVTNEQLMIHSELPRCQSIIYENHKIQQEKLIFDIVIGVEEKPAETFDRNKKLSLPDNQYKENKNNNVVKETSRVKSDKSTVLLSHQNNDQSLVMNMHTKYANKDSANQNMRALHANDGLNMHNEYADGDGGKIIQRKESEKLTIQGEEKRQVVGGVGKSKSAIKNNQRTFKSAWESPQVSDGKVHFADTDVNNVGLDKEMEKANTNVNNVGLPNGLDLADTNMNNMGLHAGVQTMHLRKRDNVGWDGDEEAEQRLHERPLEWERAREELDGYRGAGQQVMMKSQVDMVADLWQRENEDDWDANRNAEVQGSNWDRETNGRSSNDQNASKLVAVGNLLLTRDEENPPVHEKSWETGKGDKKQEGQGRKESEKTGGSRYEAEGRPLEVMSSARDKQGMEPPGDESIRSNGVPSEDKSKTQIGGRFPKQRRKQFRQVAGSLQGVAKGVDTKSVDETLDSKQPLTPSVPITARRATERGDGNRDEKGKVMEEPRYRQRQLLQQYYGNDMAYNDGGAGGEVRSNAAKEPIEVQQEIVAWRKMMGSVVRQQEHGGEPRWEELESNNKEEEINEVDEGGDYYYDGVKIEEEGKEKPRSGDDEGYYGNKDEGRKPDTRDDGKKEGGDGDDNWREDAFKSRQVGGAYGGDDAEDGEEEIERTMEDMLKMKETEGEKIFDSMWQVLETVFLEASNQEFSLMTYGGEELSLLSAKVSRSFRNASILTVIPAEDDYLMKSHRKLQESLQLTNNIITQTELTDRIVFNLYQQMEYFRFQVLGLATFQKLFTYGRSFPSYLGHMLALSQTTFIEVPHPVTLASLQVLLHSTGKGTSKVPLYKGFLSASLEEAGILDYSITVLNKVYLQNHARLVRVDIHAFYRQVTMDCSGFTAWFKQDASKPISLAPLSSAAAGDFPIQKVGRAIRLQSLLSLGLHPNERKLLFREYLKLAVHRDMCPLTILWQRGRLLYSPIIDSTIENPDRHIPYANDRRALVETMMKQLDMRPFSFMEYGTGQDGLSISLATKYPNSTFILVAGSQREVERRQDDLDERNISNAVVIRMGVEMSFTSNLVSSPDFMRYQYIGVDQLFTLMTMNKPSVLKFMFGDIVSTGVTTFFQMPSAQMFSLAISTLYPEILCNFKETESMDSFQASSHPLPLFKNFELRLLKENIELQAGQVNLSASVIHPQPNPDGSQRGWSMVRMDVRQLNVMVDHHFMYVLDGHKRKYSLHCESNATHYEVYLVRAHDGFKIPYQEVKGISLIALLRMGLLPKIKENFYNQFLRLPLYSDMAPWNILFAGGQLEYIDYDTKQMTLDKVAPAAYQIMAMLLNYRRTVDDFGHCNFNGRNPYGFDLVSHCVGNNYDTPCTDERFPVACADQTCRGNYIECLRALSEIEQKHSGIKAVGGSAQSHSLSKVLQDQKTASYQENIETEERLELSFKGQR